MGVPKSMNKALGLARGEYLAKMDADDISVPLRFEKQVKFFDTHEDAGVIGGNIWYVNSEGKKVRESDFPLSPAKVKWCLSFFNPVSHSSAMMRKDVVNRAGGYDMTFRYAQDYALWGAISRVSNIYNMSDVLVWYRVHDGCVSKVYSGEQRQNTLEVERRYISSIIGEEIPVDYVTLLENRQGEDDGLPEVIYKLYDKAVSTWSMSRDDEKFIRTDAAKKILYRYDLISNKGRRQGNKAQL